MRRSVRSMQRWCGGAEQSKFVCFVEKKLFKISSKKIDIRFETLSKYSERISY